jgi:hypothetical protein
VVMAKSKPSLIEYPPLHLLDCESNAGLESCPKQRVNPTLRDSWHQWHL